MNDGIWWLLIPGQIVCALVMYLVYQALRNSLFFHCLAIHDLHRLVSLDMDWGWRQLLQTGCALGIGFSFVRWQAAQVIRRYFEPSAALYNHVYEVEARKQAREQ
jgi:hypothetical protein